MDIDEMEAGRKLDALVAEKVMGWTAQEMQLVLFPSSKEQALEWGWEEYTEENYDWRRGWLFPDFKPPLSLHHPIGWDYRKLPRYSIDIAAAWSVVEKLGLAIVPQSAHGGFDWLALDLELVRYGNDITLVERGDTAHSAPTAQLAICRAALKAVEEVE